MKGPYERLKYELRRLWECPSCQQKQRTDGTITGLYCKCQGNVREDERVSMRLVQDGIRRSEVKQPQPSAPPETAETQEVPQTAPTNETSEPTNETSEPTNETSEPTNESSEPTNESSEPTNESSEPTNESSEPTNETSEPTNESSEPTNESSEPTSESSEPTSEQTEANHENPATSPEGNCQT